MQNIKRNWKKLSIGNNQSQFEIVSQLTNSTAVIRADMNFFTSIYPPPVTLRK